MQLQWFLRYFLFQIFLPFIDKSYANKMVPSSPRNMTHSFTQHATKKNGTNMVSYNNGTTSGLPKS